MSIRERVADLFDRLAVKLLDAARRVRPVDTRPRCPDCQIGPDLGPDVECPVCREQWEHQRVLNEVDRAAYSAGYADAMRTVEEFDLT